MISNLGDILTPYKGEQKKVVDNQITADIIALIEKVHNKKKSDYDRIAINFWKGNVKDTAKFLFDYVRKNIRYAIETKDRQTVKHPSALVREKIGDCKHMASFIVGVGDALNRLGYPIEAGFMYVNANDNSKNYHHVFAVLRDPVNDVTYWVDPIPNTSFNQRKKYLTKKFVPMALYEISGDVVGAEVGKKAKKTRAEKRQAKQQNAQIRKENKAKRKERRKYLNSLPKAEKKAIKKQERQEKHESKKAVRKLTNTGEKVAHVALKVPNAISRNAFLGLVKLNMFHMAGKMAAKAASDKGWLDLLKRNWYAAGGDWSKLKQAINQGVNVHNKKFKENVAQIGANDEVVQYDYSKALLPMFTPWQETMCNCQNMTEAEDNADAVAGRIGEPDTVIAVAAAVAAALPIILKLVTVLKKAGVDTDKIQEDGNDATEEVIDEYNDAQDYPIDSDDPGNSNGNGSPQFGIKAYNDPKDGTATVQYTKSNLDDNGDVSYTSNNLDLDQVFSKGREIWQEHKTTILLVGLGLVLVPRIPQIIDSILPKKKRRR